MFVKMHVILSKLYNSTRLMCTPKDYRDELITLQMSISTQSLWCLLNSSNLQVSKI